MDGPLALRLLGAVLKETQTPGSVLSGGASNFWSLDGEEVRDGVGMCHARGLRWCAGGVAKWGGGEHTVGVWAGWSADLGCVWFRCSFLFLTPTAIGSVLLSFPHIGGGGEGSLGVDKNVAEAQVVDWSYCAG